MSDLIHTAIDDLKNAEEELANDNRRAAVHHIVCAITHLAELAEILTHRPEEAE